MVEMPESRGLQACGLSAPGEHRVPGASGLRGDQTAEMRSQAATGDVDELRDGEVKELWDWEVDEHRRRCEISVARMEMSVVRMGGT